jgi:hypothetical protein
MVFTSRLQKVALHPSPQEKVDARVKRAAGWGRLAKDSPPSPYSLRSLGAPLPCGEGWEQAATPRQEGFEQC